MPPSVVETLAPVAGLAVTLSEDVLSVTIDRPDSDVDNDFTEGARAFQQRRTPTFTDR